MLIYISLALAALVLIVAVAFRLRSNDDRQPGDESAPRQARAASPTLVDAPVAPEPPAGAVEDDPDATRIYIRPNQATAPAASRKGDDAPSLTLSGVHLVGLNGKQKGQHFPIATTGITIGRSSSCDIVLTDSCVSGRHAWIGLVDGKITLRDLQSTNGTFLNAQLRTPVNEVKLRSGDTIFIGGHLGEQFRFEVD